MKKQEYQEVLRIAEEVDPTDKKQFKNIIMSKINKLDKAISKTNEQNVYSNNERKYFEQTMRNHHVLRPIRRTLNKLKSATNPITDDSGSAEIWDTLGQPSGRYDYLVRYTAPPSALTDIEDIQATGWVNHWEV